MLAIESGFAAPVSCSAIRKSDAARTPRASPFGISSTVGLPAPTHTATWSKPIVHASSSVTVPPKRTPPNIANSRRRSSSRRISFRKVLVPAHRDAVFRHAAESGHHARAERFVQFAHIADRTERRALPERVRAGEFGGQGFDLQAVDADHGVAVVHQVVRDRESGRPEADDQYLSARRRTWNRAAQAERVPAREQRVDLEAPRQLEHVLQRAGLGLGDIDRLLLLVDAGFHAVVADAVPGGGHHRVVHADDRQRGERRAAGLELMELRNLLLQRAARQRHAERGLLESLCRRLLLQSRGTGVLALFVAPDAVVRLIERAGEVGAGIGEVEALAAAQVVSVQRMPIKTLVRASAPGPGAACPASTGS